MSGYATGFEDQTETSLTELSWEGQPPRWLRGDLFRNGPGRYNRGKVEVSHWFDGLALLHGFRLAPDSVTYHSHFVRSYDYRRAQQTGEIASPGFACDPCRSLFRKVMSAFVVDSTDNPNVSLVKQGGRFLALTELPIPMEFDPATLRSVGPHIYRDQLPQGSTTAHPHQDQGELFNQVLHYSGKTSYRLYTQSGLQERREYARVKVAEASYVHSFGLAPRHTVLVCPPFQVVPLKLLLRDRPFIENFSWKPREGTRFHIVSRPPGPSKLTTLETEPLFTFHHVNSFMVDDETMLVDLIAYDDARIIEQLRLSNLRQGGGIDFGYLRRYRLHLGDRTIERVLQSQHPLELPRISYSRYNTRSYRWVYGIGADREKSLFYDRLLKLHPDTDNALIWYQENCYPGEPIFVADPEGKAEDDGVLLSVVLGSEEERSFLLVLDARDMSELARAWLPVTVPHGFHGLFERA